MFAVWLSAVAAGVCLVGVDHCLVVNCPVCGVCGVTRCLGVSGVDGKTSDEPEPPEDSPPL